MSNSQWEDLLTHILTKSGQTDRHRKSQIDRLPRGAATPTGQKIF